MNCKPETDAMKPTSNILTIVRRFRWLLLLAILLNLIALLFRYEILPPNSISAPKVTAYLPTVTKAHVSSEELRGIIDSLMQSHRWFNTLPFGHFEYEVTVTKSDAIYKKSIAKIKASFPESEVDETTFPDLAREWKIFKTFTFNESRLFSTQRSNALEMELKFGMGRNLLATAITVPLKNLTII